MKVLEAFTQTAYLRTAAVRPDCEIFESPEVAYIRTPSSKERWMNAIVRMSYPPHDFGKVERVIELFDEVNINFNWHYWPSSHPELLPFLLKTVKLHTLGALDFVHKQIGPSNSSDHSGIEKLSKNTFNAYVLAKMAGWNNDPKQLPEIEQAARVALHDPRQNIFLLIFDSRVVGAVGSFREGLHAYLRGDFIVPEFRGRGLYRKLIHYREEMLGAMGVKSLAVLADQATSSSIYQNLGYSKTAEINLLSRRKSPWISL